MRGLRRGALLVGGAALSLLLSAVPAAAVSSTPSPTYATNGQVYAIARSGNSVFVGGNFTQVGPATGGGVSIARSSGTVDNAMPKVSGGVTDAVVPDGAGGWYIGGNFNHVGGVPRSNLAHIRPDKTVDPSFNAAPDGQIFDLVLSNGTLYVAGYFSNVGGQARRGVAALDPSTGAATSWNANVDNNVRLLALSGSTLYLAGDFSNVGGLPRAGFGAVSTSTGLPTAWNPNATDGGDRPSPYALTVSGSTVYIGGNFNEVGGLPRWNVAAVDAIVGAPTTWKPDADGKVSAITVSGSTIYIGGEFDYIGGGANTLRPHLAAVSASSGQATSWNPNTGGGAYPQGVDAIRVAGSTVYVAGSFGTIGGKTRNNLAALSAGSAKATPWNPNVGSEVQDIAVTSSAVYAAGGFTTVGGAARNGLAALDASTGAVTAWNPNPTGIPPNTYGTLVEGLAVSGSTLYVGGQFTSIGGQPRTSLAAVDTATGAATSWNPNPTSPYGVTASALTVSGNTVYVSGGFTSIGGQPRTGAAALDATTGAANGFDPEPNGALLQFVVNGSYVYAAGQFRSIGGQPRLGLAQLDPATGAATAWDAGANNNVQSIAISGSTLYAGGWFSTLGGQPRSRIGAIDIGTGQATGFNPNSDDIVDTVAVSGSNVYAGGYFRSIGGAARANLAELDSATGAATGWDSGIKGLVDVVNVADDGTLYAGGLFRYTDLTPLGYFAAFR